MNSRGKSAPAEVPPASTPEKANVLYCGNFPPDLKKRCEDMAGLLRQSISEFVAEILEAETLDVAEDLRKASEAVTRWREIRRKAGKLGKKV